MKKHLSFTSMVLAAVMLCTACGAAPGSGTMDSTGMSNTSAPAASVPAEEKTLTYYSCWTESEVQAEVLKHTIERFEADTGYEVNVQWIGRDINKTAGIAIDAGEVDVYDADAALLAPENALDIDALAEACGMKDDILPVYGMWQSSVSPAGDGHWYAVPYQPFVTCIYYNKAIFREAGVDAMPATWEEFLDVCAKIKAAGYDPMTVDDAYVTLLYMQQLGLCMGKDAACALGTATGEAWNDPKVLDVMQKWEEFTKLGYFSATVGGNQFPAAQNTEFALGTAAMYLNSSWLPNEVSSIAGPDFEWGMMYMPAMNDGEYRIPQMGCCELAVSPNTKDPEGAVLLLKYMTDRETCQELADKAMCLPLVDGVEWPAMLADAQSIFNDAADTFRYMVWSANSEVSILSDTYFHQLIGGSCTAAEFVRHMVDGQ